MASAVRQQLGTSVASAAGPYGYTISLGGSIALATDRLGTPHLAGALMLMLGAVLAFVVLEATAQGSVAPQETPADHPPSVLGNAHVPSAGGALLAVWLVVQLSGPPLGWAAAGFAATATYFAVTAVQRIAVAALLRGCGLGGTRDPTTRAGSASAMPERDGPAS